MARECVPVPIEYLAEMSPLSDADFGRLIRALLRYGQDGTPVDLDGDCRFYAVRVMNKDDHYALRAEEDAEKAQRRSSHAKKAAMGRYAGETEEQTCSGMLEHAQAGNTNTKPNQDQTKPDHSNTNTVSAEAGSTASTPAIPLVDKSVFVPSQKEISAWQEAYPAVDVIQQLREMRAWCLANPKLCKTRNGVKRFVVSWLSKEQDKGHPGMAVKAKPVREFVPSDL